ncbi:MAG TPA: hypothetical protein VII69_12175 [Candidatus Eremiobacteraceae bacterium]
MAVTRHLLRGLSITLIAAVLASPCLAAPTVIAELGSYPLLGSNKTLTDLQISIAHNEDRLATAAKLVGMSPAEYRAFRIATQTQRPEWGRVPLRLDAMAWYSFGQVRVIHNVEIPRATYGFEYDEAGPTERLRIFLPVACGNLSILRERIMRAAAVKPPAAVSAIPQYVAAPLAIAKAAPASSTEAPPPPMPAAAPTPLPTINLGSRSSRGFFPFIGMLLGFLTVGGGSGGHNGGGIGGGGGGGCGCTINH